MLFPTIRHRSYTLGNHNAAGRRQHESLRPANQQTQEVLEAEAEQVSHGCTAPTTTANPTSTAASTTVP